MANVADPDTLSAADRDQRDAHLRSLHAWMQGHDREADLVGDVVTVYGAQPEGGGVRPVETITCKRRASDGDRWWFKSGADWIEQATHIVDATVAITGRLAGEQA
ncbi:hypothetical protein GCM10010182_67820 [Actinomadura cremea]|nr:hypothetical protein GCM10010182_67820 [Actinomadura cremea]